MPETRSCVTTARLALVAIVIGALGALQPAAAAGTRPPEAGRFTAGPHGHVLTPGEVLRRGDYLRSRNGRFALLAQRDGNLVLYRVARRPRSLWSTGSDGVRGARVTMQPDGNLVLVNRRGRPMWASNTSRFARSRLVLRNDGDLVIVTRNGRQVWSRHVQRYRWWQGQVLRPGTSFRSLNGRYLVTMRRTGNLTVWRRSDRTMIWSSGTGGHRGAIAQFARSGDLVVLTRRWTRTLWRSGTGGHENTAVYLFNDGNLVVFDNTTRRPLWASGADPAA